MRGISAISPEDKNRKDFFGDDMSIGRRAPKGYAYQ